MRNHRTLLTIAISALLLFPALLHAQDHKGEASAVQEVIETLFDGMRASDSSMVSSAFTKDAIMKTIGRNREGKLVIQEGNLDGFLKAVGSPKEQTWDEQISSYDINIDGELATVWTPYKFFLDDKFSHCGVNSFQLAKLEGDWKIFFIVDTRRRDNCTE